MDWRYAVTAWVALAGGCASPGGDQAGVKLATEGGQSPAVAAEAEVKASADLDATAAIADLELRLRDVKAQLEARIGDVDARLSTSVSATVGGGGDSVTAWLYAMIAGAAILYPVALRPARLALERRRWRRRVARARDAAHARSPPPEGA